MNTDQVRERMADKARAIASNDTIRFICAVCGMAAPEPVLCVNDECLTRNLMAPSPSGRKH